MKAEITIGLTVLPVKYNLETFERLTKVLSDSDCSVDIPEIASCDSFTVLEHLLILRIAEKNSLNVKSFLSALCEFVDFSLPVHLQILETEKEFKDASR
jgi:hypothetical protein